MSIIVANRAGRRTAALLFFEDEKITKKSLQSDVHRRAEAA
nr:hypothetical protein [Streptomyces sp. S1D4-11]